MLSSPTTPVPASDSLSLLSPIPLGLDNDRTPSPSDLFSHSFALAHEPATTTKGSKRQSKKAKVVSAVVASQRRPFQFEQPSNMQLVVVVPVSNNFVVDISKYKSVDELCLDFAYWKLCKENIADTFDFCMLDQEGKKVLRAQCRKCLEKLEDGSFENTLQIENLLGQQKGAKDQTLVPQVKIVCEKWHVLERHLRRKHKESETSSVAVENASMLVHQTRGAVRRLEFIQGNGVSIEEELEKRRNSEREQRRMVELNLFLGDLEYREYFLFFWTTRICGRNYKGSNDLSQVWDKLTVSSLLTTLLQYQRKLENSHSKEHGYAMKNVSLKQASDV